jgi:hypothetical protein
VRRALGEVPSGDRLRHGALVASALFHAQIEHVLWINDLNIIITSDAADAAHSILVIGVT